MCRNETRGAAAPSDPGARPSAGCGQVASIEAGSTEMKPDAPKPEPTEEKFDQAQEEAFSNEGAPPPTEARSKAVVSSAPVHCCPSRRPAAAADRSRLLRAASNALTPGDFSIGQPTEKDRLADLPAPDT